jgi:hypothetical protein
MLFEMLVSGSVIQGVERWIVCTPLSVKVFATRPVSLYLFRNTLEIVVTAFTSIRIQNRGMLKRTNSVASVRERTNPSERPPLV